MGSNGAADPKLVTFPLLQPDLIGLAHVQVFFPTTEDRCTGSPSGHEGFRELQRDRHHPRFHGSGGRTAAIGHGCRMFPTL